jgi:hypothetical protein
MLKDCSVTYAPPFANYKVTSSNMNLYLSQRTYFIDPDITRSDE